MIKICGLREAAAVQAAVREGADAVGFVFAASVRRVTPAQAAALVRAVPAHVRRVAVMLHPAPDEWQEVLDEFRPDVLQTDAGDFASLSVPAGIECWPVLREDTIDADAPLPPTFLYEGRASGTGETVDWARAADYARRGRMLLAGGLAADNVAAAIAAVRPWGVDVSSAVESAPGRKDAGKIAAFIHAARAALAN